MKKVVLVMLVLFFALFTAACGGAEETLTSNEETQTGSTTDSAKEELKELTLTHQLGETVVTTNPSKVVVFDFGVLDSLDKLGVEVTGVPQANIPAYLEKYKDAKYENVGSLKEPDFEKIASLNPDLIIISGRQQEAYAELSKIGPTIFMGLDTSRYMESFAENMTRLGEIFGKEEEVKAELATIEADINSLNEKATAAGKGLIVLANEGNISAYGAGSRFGILHDVFGFAAADENIEVSTHGQNVSFEYIVEKDPDFLFVIDRGAAVNGQSSAKTLIENSLTENTKAFKEGNIVYLDPNFWYLSGGGLVSVSEMIKEISAVLE
ncbi:siderophore ABC transporter substrate-binding protein [Cytobacillus suaedae]|nr:siderophore ABC transporter substrate-binding protein [Cytobacillus suaedae]